MRITSFRATCQALSEYVKAHEGCTLEEALSAIPHHYSSLDVAKSTLSKWLRKRVIDGVSLGWRQRLFTSIEHSNAITAAARA